MSDLRSNAGVVGWSRQDHNGAGQQQPPNIEHVRLLNVLTVLPVLVAACLFWLISTDHYYLFFLGLFLAADLDRVSVDETGNAKLLVLGVASPLGVMLKHLLLHHVAVGYPVDVVSLGRCEYWKHRRWLWSSHHSKQASHVDHVHHNVSGYRIPWGHNSFAWIYVASSRYEQ